MSTPAPASTTAPATRSRAGALLLSLLVLAALAAGGWYGWRAWQGRQAQQQAIAQQQQAALDARLDALKQGQRAQSQRLQQTEATNRLLRDEVLGIGQRAALIEDSVSRLADPDRQGDQALRLDQIELILAIGQQRLQLDGDMDGARRALALAGPLLDGLNDPAYLNLRQLLAQERAALDALGPDPRLRAQALLDQLDSDIPGDGAGAADAARVLPWYERVLQRIIRSQPTAGATLRERVDREAAIAALQIEASLARAMVERRDQDGLDQRLARMDTGLQRLLAGTPQLAQKQRLLRELDGIALTQASPLAGSTLQQLRTLRAR